MREAVSTVLFEEAETTTEHMMTGGRVPRRCAIRTRMALVIAVAIAVTGCDDGNDGPISVSAIGGEPALRNPNRKLLDAPSAFLMEMAAQGLVRFEASGQIEPALAQRWIVSDDGLRYTFRLARTTWSDGKKVTADQVVARLKAATTAGSRNPLKPLLGAVEEMVAMTDDVFEISLKSPRPNFLQLLAQPEMSIMRNGIGTGPYRALRRRDGAIVLALPPNAEGEDDSAPQPRIRLRGERAALAVARFETGRADVVIGGTAGDLPIARAAQTPAPALRFDPVAGLLGLTFLHQDGPLATAAVRDALSKAIDRSPLVASLGVPGLQPRDTLLPPGLSEVPQPAAPLWSGRPLLERQATAARTITAFAGPEPIRLRVAMPPGAGYRPMFAHLRRNWRQIGVIAEAVAWNAPADLQLVDHVAPVTMASWYLRSFTCKTSAVCSPAADVAMDAARIAIDRQTRSEALAQADQLLRDAIPFIPLTAPVRWSLVSPRLTGFQPNPFGRHAAGELIARRR